MSATRLPFTSPVPGRRLPGDVPELAGGSAGISGGVGGRLRARRFAGKAVVSTTVSADGLEGERTGCRRSSPSRVAADILRGGGAADLRILAAPGRPRAGGDDQGGADAPGRRVDVLGFRTDRSGPDDPLFSALVAEARIHETPSPPQALRMGDRRGTPGRGSWPSTGATC